MSHQIPSLKGRQHGSFGYSQSQDCATILTVQKIPSPKAILIPVSGHFPSLPPAPATTDLLPVSGLACFGHFTRKESRTTIPVPTCLVNLERKMSQWVAWAGGIESVSLAESESSCSSLEQRFPTFLAPGTSFMEDSFSTDWRWDDFRKILMRSL